MRPPRTELTLTEWIVLALTAEGPTHGWAIAQALRPKGSIGAAWSSPAPLVYRAVRLLADSGLVHITGAAAGKGPSRKVLEITAAGRAAVDEWLATPADHVRDLRTELVAKLLLHERRGLDPSALVDRQRERLGPLAASLAERAASASGADLVIAAWRSTAAAAALDYLGIIGATRTTGATPRPPPP
jgi:PadR family transcriptional regulator AphA